MPACQVYSLRIILLACKIQNCLHLIIHLLTVDVVQSYLCPLEKYINITTIPSGCKAKRFADKLSHDFFLKTRNRITFHSFLLLFEKYYIVYCQTFYYLQYVTKLPHLQLVALKL